MLCATCQAMPLDLFLPTPGCRHTYHDGHAWLGSVYLSGFEKVHISGAEGCVMCRLLLGALGADKPDEWIPQIERPLKTHVSLQCPAEGKLLVFEHTDGSLLRTGNLYWSSEDMKLGRRPENAISQSSSSPSAFALARSWIETCRKEHTACNQQPGMLSAPTRLIDIGAPGNHGPITPRLVLSPKGEGDVQYLALSHCWGTASGGRVPKTTGSTLAERMAGIAWDELSKTFQDALVATKGLGFRYIWIDSLCIIQDSEEDFQLECAKMGSVYSNAVCTIAASDSQTSDGGCFIPRDQAAVNGITIRSRNRYMQTTPHRSLTSPEFNRRHEDERAESTILVYPNYGFFIDSVKGVLSSRGWALQERELSSRILHYTKYQILWECRVCTASEVSPMLERKSVQQLYKEDTSWQNGVSQSEEFRLTTSKKYVSQGQPKSSPSWRLLDETSGDGPKAVMGKWYALIEAYSRRHLTVLKDKLPAISGVAAEVGRLIRGDEYVAGLWKSDMLRGLSWFSDITFRRRATRGEWPPPRSDEDIPSWSWAAFDGPVTNYGNKWFDTPEEIVGRHGPKECTTPPAKIRVLGVETTQAGPDRFGRVLGGVVRLSGWAIDASLSEAQYEPDFRGTRVKAKSYRLRDSFRNPTTMRLYFDADPEELPDVSVICLQLGHGQSPRMTSGDVGLVIMRTNNCRENRFCRIGMFDVEKMDRKWLSLRMERIVEIE